MGRGSAPPLRLTLAVAASHDERVEGAPLGPGARGALGALEMLEVLGEHPMTLPQLAGRLGMDAEVAADLVVVLVGERWVDRTGELFVFGERSLRLGSLLAATGSRRRVVDLVRMLGAATGLSVSALALVGRRAQPLARTSSDDRDYLDAFAPHRQLWVTAGGIALLAAAEPDVFEEAFAIEEWPELGPTAPKTPDAVRRIVDAARAGGAVVESEWSLPGVGCIAMPWWDPEAPSPTALAVIGPAPEVEARVAPLTHLLRAAVAPGTTAATLADAIEEVRWHPPEG